MHNQNVLTLLFVVNPVSGGKEKNDWEASICEHFKDKPHRIEFLLLTGKEDEAAIRHQIATIRPSRVVAVGGDGTVKMVAGLLRDTDLAMGIIPAGSANGMARELNIPDDPNAALDIITDGSCKKLDLVSINDKDICFHLSDMGLNAMLVKYFEQSGTRGMLGYARSVFRVLWGKKAIHATIKTDAGEIRRTAFMIVIANARTYGTGAIINPKGRMDDGVFEVVVVRKVSIAEIFKMVVTHKPFNPKRTEIFQTKNLKLTTRRKAYFQVDGELIGKVDSVEAHILPQSVFMMLPKEGTGTGF
jgi:YegS/Rv2252/BmrU family lipid kinase